RFLRAAQSFEIVRAGNLARQTRLDADDDIAVACDRPTHQSHVGTADVHQLAARETESYGDVDQSAADLRPSPHDSGDSVDVIRSTRSSIDKACHTVLQGQRR